MAKTVKISVPQESGEIIIASAGEEPVTHKVTNGHVTVDADAAPHFLVNVDGSAPADDRAAATVAAQTEEQ